MDLKIIEFLLILLGCVLGYLLLDLAALVRAQTNLTKAKALEITDGYPLDLLQAWKIKP